MVESNMCILKYVLIILFVCTETNGHISWTMYNKPAVFGHDIQLVCDLKSTAHCCTRYTRKWAKGWTYNVVTINKASSNDEKYEECLNSSASTSILTIKNIDEEDVNIPYECTYGFDTFSEVLEMKYLEYHPDETFPVNLIFFNNYLEANITMKKVYPIPKCNASDGVNGLNQNLNVTSERNGLFFTSNINLMYDIKHGCQVPIAVICMVGQTPFTVVNHTLPCLSEITATNNHVLEISVAVVVCLVIVASIVIIVMKYLKCWANFKYLFWCRLNDRNQHGNKDLDESAHNNDQPRLSQSTSLLNVEGKEL